VFLVVTMSNFGRGGGWEILEGAGAGDGGWDGMAMVKLRKKRCSTLAFYCVRLDEVLNKSGPAGRVAGGGAYPVTRSTGVHTNKCTHKQIDGKNIYIHT
jgi:hypothetical protein